ncbi:transcriptional regulator [Leptospira levettii]|uniref:helix-turn-helix transcriptional regulator n=1 Tax=Leptospira levettii TaxID=2023178 RepID=UPI0010829C5A|nr:helix-turn-helix transcriptional regulator [Leptospira levettii]TGL21535.1 transcriptional regulator [Leptospira levettii]
MSQVDLEDFIKRERKKYTFTKENLARVAGIGLRFIREIKHGNPSLRMDKVNQILEAFGTRQFPGPLPSGVVNEA